MAICCYLVDTKVYMNLIEIAMDWNRKNVLWTCLTLLFHKAVKQCTARQSLHLLSSDAKFIDLNLFSYRDKMGLGSGGTGYAF